VRNDLFKDVDRYIDSTFVGDCLRCVVVSTFSTLSAAVDGRWNSVGPACQPATAIYTGGKIK